MANTPPLAEKSKIDTTEASEQALTRELSELKNALQPASSPSGIKSAIQANDPGIMTYFRYLKQPFRGTLGPQLRHSPRTLLSFSLTCRYGSQTFKPALDKIGAEKLMQLVLRSDYAAAKKMVTANPRLMFQTIEIECPNECDIILMSSFSPIHDLSTLPITSNAAYIRCGDKLFYVDIANMKCTEIELPAKRETWLKDFDARMKPTQEAKTLLVSELEFIHATTGHTHPLTKIEQTSPLKRAFWAMDRYMWRMFEKTIKDKIEEISVKYPNPKLMSLFAKQLCEETRNLMPQFEQQLCEQTEHINIVRFFAVYEEYDIQYKRWVRHEISDAELDQEWLQLVGRAQLELLLVKKGALHLLMEFCRPGADWLPQSKFNNPAPPPQDCKI